MEFIDLKAQYQYLKDTMDKNIEKAVSGAKFIGGPEVYQLEEKLGKYVGRKHCVSCGNGTDALQLAFMALGVKKGDAVFCPDMTFIASVEPACLLGATPVFVDIDLDSYNMEPTALEKRIKEVRDEGKLNLKAVVAVDFLGNPARLEEIQQICKKYGMYFIEDAAQSMGASYDGQKCCSFGDIACTSFFPSKPLGCYGDGGAVFTDNGEFARVMKSIKVHGKGSSKYDNIRIGMNSRLDTLQAAVLLTKLEVLDEEIEKRQKIADAYTEQLVDTVQIPKINKSDTASYAQYCILLNSSEERDYVIKKMKENEIPTLVYYPNPLHSLAAFEYAKKFNSGEFKNTVQYATCNLGLPFSPYLLERDQIKVIQVLKEAVSEYRAGLQ